MKKTYIQPASTIITMSDHLCVNGLNMASVVHGGDGSHVDKIDVVEEDKSATEYDWGSGSWGGD